MKSSLTIEQLEILYSDESLIIINKPAWLLSVPGRGPDKQDSVATRIASHSPRAQIVHRLDCATSGLMVMALSRSAHRELSRQFHDREVDKSYTAIGWGTATEANGVVDLPLITDWPNRPRQKVDHQHGKSALTHWQASETEENQFSAPCTRFILKPITGRSHQLRVHLLSLGHPIIGDKLYAPAEAIAASDRLLLHATHIKFTHPTSGEPIEFYSAAPF